MGLGCKCWPQDVWPTCAMGQGPAGGAQQEGDGLGLGCKRWPQDVWPTCAMGQPRERRGTARREGRRVQAQMRGSGRLDGGGSRRQLPARAPTVQPSAPRLSHPSASTPTMHRKTLVLVIWKKEGERPPASLRQREGSREAAQRSASRGTSPSRSRGGHAPARAPAVP